MRDVFEQRTMEIQNEVNRRLLNLELRDYFAGQFLNGFSSNMCKLPNSEEMEKLAQYSYIIADAMVKAREN